MVPKVRRGKISPSGKNDRMSDATQKRLAPWHVTLPRWLVAAGFASVTCMALEVGFTLLHTPAAGSSVLGTVAWGMSAGGHILLALVPLAFLGAFIESRGLKNPLADPASLTTALVSAGVAFSLVLLGLAPFEPIDTQEFPDETRTVRAFVLFSLLLACAAWAQFYLQGWMRALFKRLEIISHPKAVPGALFLAGTVVFLVQAHFVLAAIQLEDEQWLVAYGAFASCLGFWRIVLPDLRVLATRGALSATLVVALVATSVAQRHPHGNFVLFAHAYGVGGLVRASRAALDFDGDGSSPDWWGGNDCAPFDSTRAPSIREIPGDGIDQDCTGSDAPKTAPPPPRASTLPHCTPTEGPLNVLAISIDAFRADALNAELMPRLSALLPSMISFSRAYATAPSTHFSFSGIFSGKASSDLTPPNPSSLGSRNMGYTLAARFTSAGYRTTFHDKLPLPSGFHTGFSHVSPYADELDLQRYPTKLGFTSAGLSSSIIRELRDHSASRMFTWMHYADLHAPYLMQYGTEAPESTLRYQSEVHYVDFHLGRVLDELHESERYLRTIVVITADHGEGLGQHGREGHGVDLYEEAIHVPLLLWVPGCQGQTIHAPVSLKQLGATLGALTGVDVPGETLMEPSTPRPIVSEVVGVAGRVLRAVVGPRYKLMVDARNGGRLLFDLKNDPLEAHDIYGKRPKTATEMEKAYQQWLDSPGVR